MKEDTKRLFAELEDEDPSKGLAGVVGMYAVVGRAEVVHVRRALAAGWSWRQIGAALGISRQAAHKRHARSRKVERAEN